MDLSKFLPNDNEISVIVFAMMCIIGFGVLALNAVKSGKDKDSK